MDTFDSWWIDIYGRSLDKKQYGMRQIKFRSVNACACVNCAYLYIAEHLMRRCIAKYAEQRQLKAMLFYPILFLFYLYRYNILILLRSVTIIRIFLKICMGQTPDRVPYVILNRVEFFEEETKFPRFHLQLSSFLSPCESILFITKHLQH